MLTLIHHKVMRFLVSLCVAAVVVMALFITMRYLVMPNTTIARHSAVFDDIVLVPVEQARSEGLASNGVANLPTTMDVTVPGAGIGVPKPSVPDLTFETSPLLLGSLSSPEAELSLTMPFAPEAPRLELYVDREPVLLKKIDPIYPITAFRRGIETVVRVRIHVSEQGRVTQIDIVTGDVDGLFADSVNNAIEQWVFDPKLERGKARASKVMKDIRFRVRR